MAVDDTSAPAVLGVQSTLYALSTSPGVTSDAPTMSRVDDDAAMARTLRPVGHAVGTGGATALSAGTAPANRYDLRGTLGTGGMGSVDWVWDNDLMRELAVKRLRPELRSDPGLVERFLWEARVTAFLDHPNIVPIHDLGIAADGDPYFTMKRVRGMPLSEVVQRVSNDDPNAVLRHGLSNRLRTFLAVCNAVEFAHEHGVLHRDLKPANVMVGSYGEVLVMDWGLARPLPDSAGRELASLYPRRLADEGSSGTPMYMAPEQAAGSEGADNPQADIYSLGVILYELVSLRPAFSASSIPELLDKVRGGESEALDDETARANPSAVAVISKAMAHDRAARYRSVAELRADVEAILDGRTPAAESASVGQRVARFYFGHDPRLRDLRMWDLDLLGFGGGVVGAGIGALVAPWIPPLVAVAAMFVGGGMAWAMLRRVHGKERPDRAKE